MFAIQKTFEFSAAHRLGWVAPEHPCHEQHGHNYTVTVRFEADELDEMGFVVDTHALKEFKRFLDKHCEHRDLNESLRGLDDQVTGERLAEFFGTIVNSFVEHANRPPGFGLSMVRVCETDTVCAEWWA